MWLDNIRRVQNHCIGNTVKMTAISRHPTGFLANRFTALGVDVEQGEIPDYPIPYDVIMKAHSDSGRPRWSFLRRQTQMP
jgi:hypothetical protein